MAIFYCVNKECEQIFSGEEIKGNIFAENGLLPCGHKPAMCIFNASALRDNEEKAEKWDELEPRLNAIGDEVCDMCSEDTLSCGHNPFGKKCPRF